jgi:replicative DNA helicase
MTGQQLDIIEPGDIEGTTNAALANAWDEMALLGAVMQGYDDVSELARQVQPGDFHDPRHGSIWQAILDLARTGIEVTALTVLHQMGSDAHKLPGGGIYLSNLLNPLQVHAALAPRYAANVREASTWRRIAQLGQRCQQGAMDVDLSSGEFLGWVRQWFDDVEANVISESASLAEALEEVIEVAEHGEELATPTPWRDLNQLVPGWYPNRLVIVGARPGVGKSIFLENAVTDMVRYHGMEALWISLEMSKKEITQRTLSHTAKVNLEKIIQGGPALDDRDWDAIAQAKTTLDAQEHITFCDRQAQTLDDIYAAVHAAVQAARRRGKRLGLVAVDYAQLIHVHMRQGQSRQQAMGEVSRGLKALAKRYELCVLCAAQLNRNSETRPSKRPAMSDLREAGDFEQDADVVILLHELGEEDGDRYILSGQVDLIVDKQRSGPRGTRTVTKRGYLAQFC